MERKIAGRSTSGPLNDTQHEIMRRVVAGATYQDIADDRGWTRNAVADNVRVVVLKMKVPNATAAAARYAQYQLLMELGTVFLDSDNMAACEVVDASLDRLMP